MGIEIRTPRLTLRPWGYEDIEQLTLGLNDLRVARWLAFVPHPYTKSDAEDWIARCQGLAVAGIRPSAYEFAIELKTENVVIGALSLNKAAERNLAAE